jgi:hypothetical protein
MLFFEMQRKAGYHFMGLHMHRIPLIAQAKLSTVLFLVVYCPDAPKLLICSNPPLFIPFRSCPPCPEPPNIPSTSLPKSPRTVPG